MTQLNFQWISVFGVMFQTNEIMLNDILIEWSHPLASCQGQTVKVKHTDRAETRITSVSEQKNFY